MTPLLAVFVDRGWQFIADDCGVKCAYNAVGKYSRDRLIIRISNVTYRGRLVTKMGQLMYSKTRQFKHATLPPPPPCALIRTSFRTRIV